MRFLGHVNVLDAELLDGYAKIGDITIALGRGGADGEPPAPGPYRTAVTASVIAQGDVRSRVYVRPHDVDVARTATTGAFAAQVVRVTPLSGGLKIELAVPSIGSRMRADLDWERGSALGLRNGDDVFLSLRRARVFAQEAHTAAS
jgi:sulfate transport system ATP-binding protein